VAGGPFVLAAARAAGARIIPVDSEHSAIFQCLEAVAAAPGGWESRAARGWPTRRPPLPPWRPGGPATILCSAPRRSC